MSKTPAVKEPKKRRQVRTKAETSSEFAELRGRVSSLLGLSDTELMAFNARAEANRKAVATLKPDVVVSKLTGVATEVSKNLANVQQIVIEELDQLNTIQTAKDEEIRQLQELYDIDVAKAAISDLMEEYEEKEKALRANFAARCAELELEARRKETQLAADAEEAHAQRERNIATYEYEVTQRHRKVEDDLAHRLEVSRRAFEEQERQRRIAEEDREKVLASKEAQIKEVEERLAAREAEAKAEVDKKVNIATSNQKRQYEAESALAQAKHEGQVALLQAENKQLLDLVASHKRDIDTLHIKVSEAETRAAEVIKHAVDSFGSDRAFAQVRELQASVSGGNSNQGSSRGKA